MKKKENGISKGKKAWINRILRMFTKAKVREKVKCPNCGSMIWKKDNFSIMTCPKCEKTCYMTLSGDVV